MTQNLRVDIMNNERMTELEKRLEQVESDTQQTTWVWQGFVIGLALIILVLLAVLVKTRHPAFFPYPTAKP